MTDASLIDICVLFVLNETAMGTESPMIKIMQINVRRDYIVFNASGMKKTKFKHASVPIKNRILIQ